MIVIHLTPEELAARLRIAPGTLANWRCETPPKGPKWIKVGKLVRYPIAEVEKYESKQQVA